ncbi:MAG TPA: Hpt domain-containing protein [Thermohalobaculum sp.]|nr:Hpt domain-containing protein [Thermohalobaculum sp.]
MFEWRTPEPERPILDTGYLARLGGHLGRAVLAELMADGLIELTDRTARMAEMEAAGDLDAIARLGHDLVGMAGHLGLTRLSAAAAEMNRAARDGAVGKVAPRVAEVRRLGTASVEAMRLHLDGMTGRIPGG